MKKEYHEKMPWKNNLKITPQNKLTNKHKTWGKKKEKKESDVA